MSERRVWNSDSDSIRYTWARRVFSKYRPLPAIKLSMVNRVTVSHSMHVNRRKGRLTTRAESGSTAWVLSKNLKEGFAEMSMQLFRGLQRREKTLCTKIGIIRLWTGDCLPTWPPRRSSQSWSLILEAYIGLHMTGRCSLESILLNSSPRSLSGGAKRGRRLPIVEVRYLITLVSQFNEY